jgi:hypothetical protein
MFKILEEAHHKRGRMCSPERQIKPQSCKVEEVDVILQGQLVDAAAGSIYMSKEMSGYREGKRRTFHQAIQQFFPLLENLHPPANILSPALCPEFPYLQLHLVGRVKYLQKWKL